MKSNNKAEKSVDTIDNIIEEIKKIIDNKITKKKKEIKNINSSK